VHIGFYEAREKGTYRIFSISCAEDSISHARLMFLVGPTEPAKGHAEFFLSRAHAVASRGNEMLCNGNCEQHNFFCMSLRGLRSPYYRVV